MAEAPWPAVTSVYGAPAMFHNPQVVLFANDVSRLADFYLGLGFDETFRVPAEGEPIHVDVELDGYRIGIASVESTRDDHGLSPVAAGQRAAVVLWTTDTEAAFRELSAKGCRPLIGPHMWLDRLLIAWVSDPEDHPIQIVQHLTVT